MQATRRVAVEFAGERFEERGRCNAGTGGETCHALGEMREVTREIARERAGRSVPSQRLQAFEQRSGGGKTGGAGVGADCVASGAALVESQIARCTVAVQRAASRARLLAARAEVDPLGEHLVQRAGAVALEVER